MRAVQARGTLVEGDDHNSPPHPDYVVAALGGGKAPAFVDLAVGVRTPAYEHHPLTVWTGTGADAVWNQMLDLDPEELEEARETQLMALARYARVGVPDEFLGWGAVRVTTVRRLFSRLNKILTMEKSPAPGET